MSKHKVAKRFVAKRISTSAEGRVSQVARKRASSKRRVDRTDWARLRGMTEKEVLAAAWSDEDAQPLGESELEEFRPVPVPDVKAIRARLGLSQAAFASRFGVNLRTMQDWEQGRRRPEGPARLLLAVIERDPDVIPRMLGRSPEKVAKAGKRSIHVIPHPKGGWATCRDGASRVSERHETQGAAVAAARARAGRDQVEVVIHRRDGTVREGAG